jgi:DnaK suppressor protein
LTGDLKLAGDLKLKEAPMTSSLEILAPPDLAARRAVLEAKLGELTSVFQDRSGLTVENSADMLDVLCMATDRDVLVQYMNTSARNLREVRRAVDTLQSGSYGLCEDCGEPISARRLDAIPWARSCVKCQEGRDRQGTDVDVSDTFTAEA